MSNVVPLEPYRLRKRREKVAAACREAVLRSGVLVIQDQSGHIRHLVGQFSFFEDGLENARDGIALHISYDEIKKVKVAPDEQYNGRPNSG